ncbi:MAG TPA: sensor histidine kinase [Enterococcus columbae]|nr:sensor histidine kinase [Enterococcus columbae]
MFELSILMMERVGLMILMAFMLVNIPYFKQLLLDRQSFKARLSLVFIFGFFAIISNFTGIEITKNTILPANFLTSISNHAAIANTRTLVITVAGLVGGPIVGAIVGLVAGFHRLLQGNIAAFFYVPSSILIGALTGYLGSKLKRQHAFVSTVDATIIAAVMEMIQMLFILVFSDSFASGFTLIRFIGLPMILLNSVGTFTFMSMLSITLQQEEQAKAVQTHDVLELAAQTLPYFREGLHQESCRKVASIIQRYTKVSAISITDTHQILAHVGMGCDHHIPEIEVITELSKHVLKTGQLTIARSKAEVGCSHPDCPLQAAIVIPLFSKKQIVGTLKMYFDNPDDLTHVEEQLAEGLALIFSTQIELGEAEVQSKLLKEAEIKSLQAQVNPHFFFNAINTISALMRKDANKARELLLQLSKYFRGNLQGAIATTIGVKQELDQVKAYLSLEQARFPNRYHVVFDVEPEALAYSLPPYAIQVLVENTIKHGFKNRKEDNQVYVQVHLEEEQLMIDVYDNGEGIPEERLQLLGKQVVDSEKGTGTALDNLARRIHTLYGEAGQFFIENNVEGGSHVALTLPLAIKE